MNQQPVSFPQWKEALAAADLLPPTKAAYLKEIITFLRHCKTSHSAATAELARQYLLVRERATSAPAREALRWFFRTAKSAGSGVGHSPNVFRVPSSPRPFQEPPPAAQDLGGPDWERDLIKAARERGFLWRTEETYRAWGARFARFIAPRSPYAAAAEDVAAFLSELAVRQRASPSTQKQALNALVFVTMRPAVRAPRVVTLRCASGQALTQTAA